MADEKYQRFGPVALTNTLTTNVLTAPQTTGNVVGSAPIWPPQHYIIVEHMSIVNRTANPATLSLYLGDSATATSGTEVVGSGLTIPGGGSHAWYGELLIPNGRYLVGGASANSALTFTAGGRVGVGPDPYYARVENAGATHTNIGGTANAKYKLEAGGGAFRTQSNGAYVAATGWLFAGPNTAFQALMTFVSGNVVLTSGTTGAWVDLNTLQEWILTTLSGGEDNCTYTLQIRRKEDKSLVSQATITFNTYTV